MHRDEAVPTVLITGTVGSGKTALAEEMSTLLYEIGVAHAAIDLDWLCQLYPAPAGDPFNEELMLRNLTAVWRNFRSSGAGRLVLARAIETRQHLARYEQAVPGAELTVVRVVASEATIEQRLKQREIGSFLDPLSARSKELSSILDSAGAEDFSVTNEGRPLREVALEVLQRLGWLIPY